MIIVVKTPLQIICAVEYLHARKLELGKATFIYLKKYDLADSQIRHTLAHFGIENHETIRFSNSNIMTIFGKQVLLSKFKPLKAFAKVRQMINDRFSENKLFEKLQKAETIILGDPNFKLFGKIPALVKDKEIVLLDDGLGSMQIAFDYAQNGNRSVSYSFLRTGKTVKNAGTALENKFEKLRSAFGNPDENTVLFIGQPLYEAKLFSISEITHFFKEIGEMFGDKKVMYLPHRWEVNLQRIEFPANIEILPLQDLPLELSISTLGLLPGQIVSFYSSALLTLKKILPESVQFTSLDIQSGIQLADIEKAYEKIAASGIEVVAFEPVKQRKA